MTAVVRMVSWYVISVNSFSFLPHAMDACSTHNLASPCINATLQKIGRNTLPKKPFFS
jgi:hypothetical protein